MVIFPTDNAVLVLPSKTNPGFIPGISFFSEVGYLTVEDPGENNATNRGSGRRDVANTLIAG